MIAAGPGIDAGDALSFQAHFALAIDPALLFTQTGAGDGYGLQVFSYEVEVVINGVSLAYAASYRNTGDGVFLFSGEETPGAVSVEVPVVAGEAFTIAASLRTGFYATAVDSSFDGSLALSEGPHFEWLGVTGLAPEQRVASDIFDWTFAAVVPAPSASALIGFGVFGVHRRRR